MRLIPNGFTKRALLVGLLAGSGMLATSSFAVNSATGKMDCAAKHGQHGQKNHAQRMEQRAQHKAALKAKLKLTAQQEAAWNTFTAERQARMAPGGDRQARREAFAKLTTPQRLDKMMERSEMRRAKMLERAQATKAFYAQLTPEQQSVFDAQAKFRGSAGRHGGHGAHHQKS